MATLGNYIAKIGLDNAEFNKEVDATKKKASAFATSFSKLGGMAKSLAPLALGVAGVGGAMATFQKLTHSSQGAADAFDNTLKAAQLTTDSFFRALSTGDFSVFDKGLKNSIKLAKEYAEQLDLMGDKTRAYSYIESESLSKIEKFREIAKDPTSSKEQKRVAMEGWETELSYLEKIAGGRVNDLLKTMNMKYASSGFDINKTDIDYALKFTFTEDPTAKKAIEDYKKGLDGIYDKYNEVAYINGKAQVLTAKGYEDAVKAYKQENLFLAKQVWLMAELDPSRQEDVDRLREGFNLEKSITQQRELYNKTLKTSGALGKEDVKGLLNNLNADIKNLQNKLEEATEVGVAAGIKKALDAKINDKLMLESEIKYGKPENEQLESPFSYKPLIEADKWEARGDAWGAAVAKRLRDADKIKQDAEKKNNLHTIEGLKNAGAPKAVSAYRPPAKSIMGREDDINQKRFAASFETDPDKLRKQLDDIAKAEMELGVQTMTTSERFNAQYGAAQSMTGSINGLYSALSSFKSIDNPFEGLMVGIEALFSTIDMFQSFGEALKLFSAIATVEEGVSAGAIATGEAVKATAYTVTAATAAKAAAAETILAHAYIPFAGTGIAAGFIAQQTAMIAAAGSVALVAADGGIVPGSSYVGDNLTARVNSGEMILNQAQQARMFSMLNGSGGGNSNVETNQAMPSEIRLVAKGADLVGVISGYNRRKSKV